MSHVFISYSHEDADFVSRLDEIFQDEHINTWVDRKRLKAGDNWRDVIDREIKNSFALIVVLSPHAVVSPYVTYEWSFALGIGLEIIPVICRQIKFDDNSQKNREIENQLTSELEDINHRYHIKIPKPLIHPRLDIFQYIDLSHEDDNSQKWQDLISLIKEKQQNFRPHSVNIPREAPKIVHDMVARLDSEDEELRKKAVFSLSDMRIPYAEDALINALNHPLSDVRLKSAEALGVNQSRKAITELTQRMIIEHNETVRYIIIESLIKIGTDKIIPALVQSLNDSYKDIRHMALKELKNVRDIKIIPELIGLLDDSDETVQHISTQILENFGEDALPDLQSTIQNKNYSNQIRQSIARILGIIGNSKSIPTLIGCIHDDNLLLRRRIITALGEIGHPDAVVTLIECLQDDEDIIRRESALALGKIKSKDAIPSLIIALQDDSYRVRENAALSLGEIGDPQTVSKLIDMLEDKTVSVRRTAIIGLSKIANDEAIRCLIQILGSPDNHIREFTIQALESIFESAEPYLKEAIKQDNESIKLGVTRVLINKTNKPF